MQPSSSQKIVIDYYQEVRSCKKNDCSLCCSGKKHSPYYFASTAIDGIERHVYIGSKFRTVTLQDFQKSIVVEDVAQESCADETEETISRHDKLLILHSKALKKAGFSTSEYIHNYRIEVVRIPKASTDTLDESDESEDRPRLPSEQEFFSDLKRFKTIRLKDVKFQYRNLIKKYHPDRFGHDHYHVQEWMKIINQVNETHLRRKRRLPVDPC
ncbi:J domain-containing protein [Deltaproteobacteria bacterium TL4]